MSGASAEAPSATLAPLLSLQESAGSGEEDDEALLGEAWEQRDAPGGEAAESAAAPAWAWWVLGWYFYLSALQSLLWMTFSSVPDHSRAYLSVSDGVLDLWLDYGPAAFCLAIFPALWLLSARADGLRLSVLVAAAACAAAAALRCLPLALGAGARGAPAALAAVHVAQFINGAVAPFVVASPSLLALVWFPEAQRNSACAVANVASAVGRGVGFFLGPALVHAADDVPTLLLLELALAVLPLVAVAWHSPAAPARPPSRAAAAEARALAAKVKAAAGAGGLARSVAVARREVVRALTSPSFMLIAVAGGTEMAVFGMWSGVLPAAVTAGGAYTDAQAGVFGTVVTFAGVAGALACAAATDAPALRMRLKAVVAGLSVAAAAAFALIAVGVAPFQEIDFGAAGLITLFALAGALRGGTDPLFFELCAEVAAPLGVPPGTAGAVLTFGYHVLLCVLLALPADFLQHWLFIAMAALMLASAAMLAPAHVAFTRR